MPSEPMTPDPLAALRIVQGKDPSRFHCAACKAELVDDLQRLLDRDRGVTVGDGLRGTCDLAPDGWYCSRDKGHVGPCAAYPVDATVGDGLRKAALAVLDALSAQPAAASTVISREALAALRAALGEPL